MSHDGLSQTISPNVEKKPKTYLKNANSKKSFSSWFIFDKISQTYNRGERIQDKNLVSDDASAACPKRLVQNS